MSEPPTFAAASSGADSRPAPFAPGSVSLRLYPHNELSAGEVMAELSGQAGLALAHGFDGVMTSEHHGGFPGYLPNPLQVASFILDDHRGGWAAACPLLLPLRPTALVAEEVAWLAARHPGRVGLGVAAGALPFDFEVMGVEPSTAGRAFAGELPRVVALLAGRDLGPLAGDRALAACTERPVPVLSAAVSLTAARRAARSGAGLLLEGMSAVGRLAALTSAYDEAGGTGAKALIRRVWLGEVARGLVDRQRAVYEGVAGQSGRFGDDQTVAARRPSDLAEELRRVLSASGADSLNLRIHLPGMAPEVVRQQIVRLGSEVVPLLR